MNNQYIFSRDAPSFSPVLKAGYLLIIGLIYPTCLYVYKSKLHCFYSPHYIIFTRPLLSLFFPLVPSCKIPRHISGLLNRDPAKAWRRKKTLTPGSYPPLTLTTPLLPRMPLSLFSISPTPPLLPHMPLSLTPLTLSPLTLTPPLLSHMPLLLFSISPLSLSPLDPLLAPLKIERK